MTTYLCKTCGTQYPPGDAPPPACPICEDPRQYVNVHGQQWTLMNELAADHHNIFRPQEPGLRANVVRGLALGPDVVARCHDVDAPAKQGIPDIAGDAASGCGIFCVRDDQVDIEAIY